MGAVKIVLRAKGNKDGTFPLAIRITKDRKTSFVHLGQNLYPDDWNPIEQTVRKSHPNSARLNNFLLKKKSEANDTLLSLQTQDKNVSPKAVRKEIKPQQGISFFAQAELHIENMRKEGKYNSVTSELPRIKHFKEFLQGYDIAFQDISFPLLAKFRAYLKSERKVSERTIVNHLIVIRTIYNQAIAAKIIDARNYPFGKGKISLKFPESTKIGLTIEEVKKIETLDLSDKPRLNHARNVWLFSLYFAGVRVSDVLRMKWTDIQNNRLLYIMGKNGKTVSLKIPDKAVSILAQCDRNNKHDLIFPDLTVVDDMNDRYTVQRKISYAAKNLRDALADIVKLTGIQTSMSPHIARHTFGSLSGDKISIQMLQKLYRHSSVTTTIGYQANFIHKDADEALDSVLAY